jgi:hypothetical protein
MVIKEMEYSTRQTFTEGEGLSTVGLIVLTCSDQLIFMKIVFTFLKIKATLMRKTTILSLPLQKEFPDFNI